MTFDNENTIQDPTGPSGLTRLSPRLKSLLANPVTQLGQVRLSRTRIRKRIDSINRILPIEGIFIALGLFFVYLLLTFSGYFNTEVENGFFSSLNSSTLLYYRITIFYPMLVEPLIFGTFSFLPIVGVLLVRIPTQLRSLVSRSESDTLLTTPLTDSEILNGVLWSPFFAYQRIYSSIALLFGVICLGILLLTATPLHRLFPEINLTLQLFNGGLGYVLVVLMIGGIGAMTGVILTLIASFMALRFSSGLFGVGGVVGCIVFFEISRLASLGLTRQIFTSFKDPVISILSFETASPFMLFTFTWFCLSLMMCFLMNFLTLRTFSKMRRK